MHFIFMHIGLETEQPSMLVQSIRKVMPDAKITQCTDKITNKIKGVTNIHRIHTKNDYPMSLRLELFAEIESKEGGLFVDTDMLALRRIDYPDPATNLILCRRSFDRNAIFNATYLKMDFSEYKGWRLDDVYPYLACFTYSTKGDFWASCRQHLNELDIKFHRWYGDQEALRNIGSPLVDNGLAQTISEATAACLPEYTTLQNPPFFIHFKGPSRKLLMRKVFQKICK
jgi:hypothetical protein